MEENQNEKIYHRIQVNCEKGLLDENEKSENDGVTNGGGHSSGRQSSIKKAINHNKKGVLSTKRKKITILSDELAR